MDSAPWIGELVDYPATSDLLPNDPTAGLNQRLNAVVQLPLSTPSFGRAEVVQDGGPGLADNSAYNIGFQQLPVPNQIIVVQPMEAPNVPVDWLSYRQSLAYSSQKQPQVVNPLLTSLRAPGINEGF
jgi:hypothetical protein